ncbi:uncharacterized protein LOC122507475 isoform X2 [Leptopilina heterotoma]|uniref:uncharacterized protein LOC122507475 isoform X2 n=1 Tax=Leptopilina heterotoma TaxID=63436 RepID=UPI001CA8D5A6|nr:uncharacterized protein LOC122507475 isoform X2 [Leptopilina heterotoma]
MLTNGCQTVNLDTEIRKLQPLHFDKLAWLLNISDGDWKKFMFIIPSDNSGQNKFGIDHLNLIEQASRQQKRGCAAIFLEEWSTMGRKRPTLKMLLELLKKAQLFRAADYVSMNILNNILNIKKNVDLQESDITEKSSILGDVHEERSVSNEGQNVPVPEEERKIDAPIPAFLSNMTFSNVEEDSAKIVEIPNRVATLSDAPPAVDKSQKVHQVGNGEAYKIPAFLANASFSNLSEAAESTQSGIVNEASNKDSSDCEIKGTIPRFLCESSSLISPPSASQDEIAFISSGNFSQNTLKDAPAQGNYRDVGNELPSSKENQEASQLPILLNKVSLSDFSGVVEYGKLNTEKSSTRIRFSSQFVKETIPKIPHQEIVQSKTSHVSHQEPQESNKIKENIHSLPFHNERVSKLPACLNNMNFSNFSIISEGDQLSFTNGLNSDSVDV